jgi:hypothetical protein
MQNSYIQNTALQMVKTYIITTRFQMVNILRYNKRRSTSTRLHGVRYWKAVTFIFAAVGTWNLTSSYSPPWEPKISASYKQDLQYPKTYWPPSSPLCSFIKIFIIVCFIFYTIQEKAPILHSDSETLKSLIYYILWIHTHSVQKKLQKM